MPRSLIVFAIALLPSCNAPAANEHLRPEYVAACLSYNKATDQYRRGWSPEQYLPHDNPTALCNCLFDKLQPKFDEDQLRYFINLHLAVTDDAAQVRANQIADTHNAKQSRWALDALEAVMSMDDDVAQCEQTTRTKPSLIGADTFFNF